MIGKDKYSINFRGLPLGENHISMKYGDNLFVEYAESGICNGKGDIEIDLLKHASMMELTVTIKGEVEVECDRCLGLYTQPIDLSAQVVAKISEVEGEYDGDIIWLNPREDALDLKQWIYESIVLSLPIQRVHSSKDECDPEALKYITGEVDINEIDEE